MTSSVVYQYSLTSQQINYPARINSAQHWFCFKLVCREDFAGGTLVLQANSYWQAAEAVVPAVAKEGSAIIKFAAFTRVGFKTVADLDVMARVDLYDNNKQLVACPGTFSTGGALWHKTPAEFAGDIFLPASRVVAADDEAENGAGEAKECGEKVEENSSVPSYHVMFVGAEPAAGVSTLLNTALTLLSFEKHPVRTALVGCPALKSDAPKKTEYTPTFSFANHGTFKSRTRLHEIENAANADLSQLLELTAHQDTVVFVVPATTLAASSGMAIPSHVLDMYRALVRQHPGMLVAITKADLAPEYCSENDDLVRFAQRAFRTPENSIFVPRVYLKEKLRTLEVERGVFELLYAAAAPAGARP